MADATAPVSAGAGPSAEQALHGLQGEASAPLPCAPPDNQAASEAAPERGEGAEDAMQCVICLTERKCVMVEPCAHLCLCRSCAGAGSLRECPLCRGHAVRHLPDRAQVCH